MKEKGFTLIEALVVLTILGFFALMTLAALRDTTDDASNVVALNEMRTIKEAIRERFYPDLGLIPEARDPGPDGLMGTADDVVVAEYSTMFLCLRDDGGTERAEMLTFLANNGRANLIDWDRFSRRGWRGPYMEHDIRHDVGGGVFIPLIATPWAGLCETRAQRESDAGDAATAAEYLRGRYYLILVERYPVGHPQAGQQITDDARIISFGANGLDDGAEGAAAAALRIPEGSAGYVDIGDDLVMFIFGTGPTRRP